MLHLLSELVILKGVLTLVVVCVFGAALVVYGEGERAVISGIPITVTDTLYALLVFGGLAAGVSVGVGALGIWGSNRPQKIKPFLVVAALALVLDLVQAVGHVIERGVFGLTFDLVLDIVFMLACVYLAFRIDRQPTPEELAAAAGVALVSGPDLTEES